MPRGVAKKNNNTKRTLEDQNSDKENNVPVKKTIEPEKNVNKGKLLQPSQNISNIEKFDHDLDNESNLEDNSSTLDSLSNLNTFVDNLRGSINERTLSDSTSQKILDDLNPDTKELPGFFQKIDNWMYGKIRNPFRTYQHVIGSNKKKRSPIRMIFVTFLFVALIYLMVLGAKNLDQIAPISIPTKTTVPTYAIPTPFSIQIPGGWTFLLETSSTSFPEWNPTRAEWFKDTTICKLVAIPWSKQIDAVYKTLEIGDNIILTMNNKDEAIYQIEILEISLVEKLIDKLSMNTPCMIIFLYREGTITSQVIISKPAMP